MEMLRCSICHQNLSTDQFNKRSAISRGYSYYCKECVKSKRAYVKNKNVRKYFVDLVRNARSSAKSRKITDFELTPDFLVELYNKQNEKCPVTGIELTCIAGNGVVYSNASIDRIDNSKGYLKNNVQLLCRSANSMKLNMNQDEFVNFMNNMSTYWLSKELS